MNAALRSPFEAALPTIGSAVGSRGAEKPLERRHGVVLSIVVPTFNEAGNIAELIRRIDACLPPACWEVIVVDDDSADGTADVVAALAGRDDRLRCLRRVGRRGLASACLEGMAMARGRYYAVIDADLQHDERLLPEMLRAMVRGDADVVVGSRYVAGGGVAAWSPVRRALSRAATWVTHLLLRVQLSDPMSGFFMIRADALARVDTSRSGRGFKLLLEIVASSPATMCVVELPYEFAVRTSGQSKLGARVAWCFVQMLARQCADRIPRRFLEFCAIGATGVAVHLSLLWALQRGLNATFPAAQTAAVLVSMASNFWLNNRLAFGDRRLRGARFLAGLSRFAALCVVGATVNVVLAEELHRAGLDRFAAAFAGILAGALCNYATVSRLVWRS